MLTPQSILKDNAEKPRDFRFDPRTLEGKKYLKNRERSVRELKAALGDLCDPNVFYTKHALILAVSHL